MRKAALCLLAAVFMSGCGAAPVKRYFQIRMTAANEPALPKVDRRVLVEPAAVDPLYDDVRILYRVAPNELMYYPYEFWAERPGRQIGTAMAEFLTNMKVFPAVWQDRTKGEPEVVLRSRVHALEEVDTSDVWQGRLAMVIEFVDAKTGAPIVSRSFDRSGKMFRRDVGVLPGVVSRLLGEELGKAVWELAHAVEKR